MTKLERTRATTTNTIAATDTNKPDNRILTCGVRSLQDIRQHTALDEIEAQRTTTSLCEYKILKRVKEEDGQDKLALNENFMKYVVWPFINSFVHEYHHGSIA